MLVLWEQDQGNRFFCSALSFFKRPPPVSSAELLSTDTEVRPRTASRQSGCIASSSPSSMFLCAKAVSYNTGSDSQTECCAFARRLRWETYFPTASTAQKKNLHNTTQCSARRSPIAIAPLRACAAPLSYFGAWQLCWAWALCVARSWRRCGITPDCSFLGWRCDRICSRNPTRLPGPKTWIGFRTATKLTPQEAPMPHTTAMPRDVTIDYNTRWKWCSGDWWPMYVPSTEWCSALFFAASW